MASTVYDTAMNCDQLSGETAVENNIIVPKEKKKRSRNPDNWIKEKRKRAILSGQSYLNTKGELVGPKTIGPDCHCKHKCYLAVTTANRTAIFSGYYSLKSYDEQNAYLYGLIRRYDIQRKRKPVSERRTCSYKYYVRVKGREIQVCKKAFANIHGISDKKIRTLCIKHEQNILFPRDNRGRHNNRPKKVTTEVVTLIKQHILKMLSGPNGNDFIKTDKNQSPDVNISKLHKAFLLEYEPDALDADSEKILKDYDAKVKSWLYFKVFHEEFNSMDFNIVKRKLSDLRKSLEASGIIPVSKKKVKSTTSPSKTTTASKLKSTLLEQTRHPDPNVVPNQHLGLPPGSILPAGQLGYMGPQNQHFPLSMLNLSATHNQTPFTPNTQSPHMTHQQQQQPLNLQTGGLNVHHTPTESPLSLNLHSMGGPMSSYYLCFSHVSNLISLPVSSGGPQPPHVAGHQPHVASNNFASPQSSNMQYPPALVPHQTQPVMNQSPQNILQGFSVAQHNSMY